MQIHAKYKVCRRLGSGVYDKCQTQAFMVSEARHSKVKGKRPKALSDYGRQLLEKQRIRFAYGVSERQLRRYAAEAARIGIDPVSRMINMLESRLDNAVYRAGLAPTRSAARQMVSHGHVTVGGRKVTVPSYHLREGEAFSVRDGSKTKPLFVNYKEASKQGGAPKSSAPWITFDSENLAGSKIAEPNSENTEMVGDVRTVLEFYSR
jgi:small subunit ribosomal protein S4